MFAPPPNPDYVNAPEPEISAEVGASHRLPITPPLSIRFAQYSVLTLLVVMALRLTYTTFVLPNFDLRTPSDIGAMVGFYVIALTVKTFIGWLAYQLEKQRQWAWYTLLVLAAVAFLILTAVVVVLAMSPYFYVHAMGGFIVLMLAAIIGAMCMPSSLAWMRLIPQGR